VLGITADGYKDILSITVGANGTSKFWLGMLNDLKNRGVEDILFFCVDGLARFKEAIRVVYPNAQIQRCVIHMLRNSFKYVNYSDLKKFSSDFKSVYHAPNEVAVFSELEKIKKMGAKIPLCSQQLGGCPFLLSVFQWYPAHYVYHKYHRGAQPSVPESDQDKKCVPKQQFPGKDALSCQRERGQKMDTALQELGPGVKPVDRPLRGKAYPITVKRKSWDTKSYQEMSWPYSIGISSISRNIRPYSGGRAWAEPT
jgi:hypothetical protein